jgi:hypothetical protein
VAEAGHEQHRPIECAGVIDWEEMPSGNRYSARPPSRGRGKIAAMANLNPTKVPKVLVPLLSVAERWGISDDIAREEKARKATREKLEELVHSIDGFNDEDLYEWLAGPEADSPAPTPECVALTCLTMAIDSARLQLARRDA